MTEKQVTLNDGEKLILVMLCDLFDHLKVKSDIEPEFIREAIHSGNLWGLNWGMEGIFHGEQTPRAVVAEVVDILAMWERIEQSYEALLPIERSQLEAEIGSPRVRFDGFDGNNEVKYISAAQFLIDRLGRFRHFKGRGLNSHYPSLEPHRRMVAVIEPMWPQEISNRNMTVPQLAKVLNARKFLQDDTSA